MPRTSCFESSTEEKTNTVVESSFPLWKCNFPCSTRRGRISALRAGQRLLGFSGVLPVLCSGFYVNGSLMATISEREAKGERGLHLQSRGW